jgi:uncharacterized SAM-binding protein YcdF (DUF218 family)
MTKRIYNLIGGLALLAALAWTAGLLWFAQAIPAHVADTTTRTDAIVVLTGGAERIETGLALLDEGLADHLFVSGAGLQVKTGDLLPRTPGLKAEVGEKITVGTVAANTPGNALETAAWAESKDVRSIRLVTAAYHMRRSLLEFHAAMPGVTIVPHAVFPPNVKSDWWRWPGTASLIAREYTKFVVTWAMQRLGIANRRAGIDTRPTTAARTNPQ